MEILKGEEMNRVKEEWEVDQEEFDRFSLIMFLIFIIGMITIAIISVVFWLQI